MISKLLKSDSKFFEILTDINKSLLDFDNYSKLISSEREINGYRLYKQGCELECKGDVDGAIKIYQKSI